MIATLSPRLRFWLLAPGFWLFLVTGCTTTVHPPVNPPDPVAIYVADYGRHSSLVLPAKDRGYVEWAFGDWRWFALGQIKPDVALMAIVFSPQSTLGRRVIAPQPDEAALARALDADSVMRIEVSRQRADALLDVLDRRYAKHGETQVHSNYSHLDHVKDDEHYWALNNCNHLTMRWLRQLGCRVDGFGIFSRFTPAK